MVKTCLHIFVSGKVQGVWYRASTQQQAQQLGLTGWVRNLNDGRVELVACGDTSQVEKLIDWLWDGPARADVDDVDTKVMNFQAFDSFTVRR